jgi:small subunit ribosomal protein S13
MPRIAGFDIPDSKKVPYSLRYIYGIGPVVADGIVKSAGIDPDKRARDLTGDEINRIAKELEKVMVGGNLRRIIRDNIERLKRVRSYRGMRHGMGLPVHGQRTRTNARTNKGRRKTVGAMTKEAAAKLEAAKAGK